MPAPILAQPTGRSGALGQNPASLRLRIVILLVLLLGALLSWVLTLAVRRYAIRSELLDRPNDRSSHAVPTPRGGGLAIVATFLTLATALHVAGPLHSKHLAGLVACAALVAWVGWWDDRHGLAARWRFLAHSVAAAVSVWLLGGLPALSVFGIRIEWGWLGAPLAALFMVWMTNLYNFMDGIDGIAGIEAVTVCAGAAACGWLATGTSLWALPCLLAAASAGFLAVNYPPARIFMGDVGSGFLGFVIAWLSLWSADARGDLLWCWLILAGCFTVDATLTLIRRVLRGEKFYEAHRSHADQHAPRVHAPHRVVP
ncbi:MAG: glycosyltransferase family 4 protein, partial [Burkholderiaceae bacterium]